MTDGKMAWEVLKLLLCLVANRRGGAVRVSRRAEGLWGSWGSAADRPAAGSRSARSRVRRTDRTGNVRWFLRVHRGRRDGGGVFHEARAARRFADDAGRQWR